MTKTRAGRPRAKGRFDTRDELEERVEYLWKETDCQQAQIARNCQVSETTVANIIKQLGARA